MAQYFVESSQNLCLLKRQHRTLRKKDSNIPRGQGAQKYWKKHPSQGALVLLDTSPQSSGFQDLGPSYSQHVLALTQHRDHRQDTLNCFRGAGGLPSSGTDICHTASAGMLTVQFGEAASGCWAGRNGAFRLVTSYPV